MRNKDAKLIYEAYQGSVTPLPDGIIGTAKTDLMNMSEWFDNIDYMSTSEAMSHLDEDDVKVDIKKGEVFKFIIFRDLQHMTDWDEIAYIGVHANGPRRGAVNFGEMSHDDVLKYFTFNNTDMARHTLRRLR